MSVIRLNASYKLLWLIYPHLFTALFHKDVSLLVRIKQGKQSDVLRCLITRGLDEDSQQYHVYNHTLVNVWKSPNEMGSQPCDHRWLL